MNLTFDDTQTEIASSAAEFLAGELPIKRIRELSGADTDSVVEDATWQQVSGLGWFGLSVPEEQGGLGLGLAEEVALTIELGRHLAPGPFRSTLLAAFVAARAGADDVLAELLSGEKRAGLLVGDLGIDCRVGDFALAVDADGAQLAEVTGGDRLASTDPGTRLSRVTTGSVVTSVVGPEALNRARVLAAAELLGIIEAVRDMSAAYAQTRVQFDKPIGTFQAVKHRCADMAIAAYATRAQTAQAALYVQHDHPDATFHAAAAYVLAVKGAATSTADNIQNHGGIGFTWEHDAHLFLIKAFLLEQAYGAEPACRTDLLTPEQHEFR
jgi:alkylation response protein AidB-like acyl-CoA dehydrogenase